jgi:NADPH:quinone reductase-like Zn-dependent oxidoreductase
MRAAILHEYGATPEIGDYPEPRAGDAQAVVEVAAAGLNPIDLRTATGALGRGDVPHVVGKEGIGRLADGRRVYFDSPVAPLGAFAERTLVERDGVVEVPDGVDDAHAVCYGIAGLAAWLSLERRAALQAGERVLILGASGVVGLIGVQVAKLLGAERVVAAARSEGGLARAAELGADETVRLDGDAAQLAEAFKAAAGGPLDVVLDPLWGVPAAAAVDALGFRGRLIQMGQSAGGEATLESAKIRFKEASILGHTNFAAPPDVRREALQRMWRHAAAGELVADYETVALEGVGEAWRRQAGSPNRKLVLVP